MGTMLHLSGLLRRSSSACCEGMASSTNVACNTDHSAESERTTVWACPPTWTQHASGLLTHVWGAAGPWADSWAMNLGSACERLAGQQPALPPAVNNSHARAGQLTQMRRAAPGWAAATAAWHAWSWLRGRCMAAAAPPPSRPCRSNPPHEPLQGRQVRPVTRVCVWGGGGGGAPGVWVQGAWPALVSNSGPAWWRAGSGCRAQTCVECAAACTEEAV